jgi:hypothetical protein
MNCVQLKGGPGRYSYSKIKVVRYHTMDLTYSARNQDLFFLARHFWRRRVWYVGKGEIGADFVHPKRGLQCVRRCFDGRLI